MDISQQVLKHLPRDPRATVPLIDHDCQDYQDIFPEVRSYECFKSLHLGLLSELKRKSLPEIAKPEIAKPIAGQSSQALHHFLSNSPWLSRDLEAKRLKRILTTLNDRPLVVVIDETEDRKQGNTTDYLARQYLGSIGKVDLGIVSVNAYGVYQGVTILLLWRIVKPKGRLKPGDVYKSKPEIASEILEELIEYGLEIELVLSNSLYGESSDFIQTLDRYHLQWLLSIRSNHRVLLPPGKRVRANQWCALKRNFCRKESEQRYIREIVYGKSRRVSYWQLTSDPESMPKQLTTFVMTNLQGTKHELKQKIGNLYGLRTWVEYGFRQSKQELGWTDDRSSQEGGWKSGLKNIRLMIQPMLMMCMISAWLSVFPNQRLWLGLERLIRQVNQYQLHYLQG